MLWIWSRGSGGLDVRRMVGEGEWCWMGCVDMLVRESENHLRSLFAGIPSS